MAERKRSFHYLSTSSINELEEEKQGIVTILASDCENTRVSSLRRTLSADMSSKKWLSQNRFFSSLRKIASFDESAINDSFSSSYSSSSSSDDEERERTSSIDDFWTSILSQKEKNPEKGDFGGSIFAPKSDGCLEKLPVFVHPLEKKSASSMSDHSLRMCTECIGSENGSDGFYSDYASNRFEQVNLVEEAKEFNSMADFYLPKAKKSTALLFPPPLSTICGGDGSSVLMQSHRENGRLILEAVPAPSWNHFRTLRQSGRLQLTLFDKEEHRSSAEEGNDSGVDTAETVVKEKIPVSNGRFFVGDDSISLPSGMISVSKSGLMMSLSNTTEEELLPISQSLPPSPSPLVCRMNPSPATTTAAQFNGFQYFWRNKTAISGDLKDKYSCSDDDEYKNEDLVRRRRNKTEYFVPYLKGCRENRSLLIWEPYCIATS